MTTAGQYITYGKRGHASSIILYTTRTASNHVSTGCRHYSAAQQICAVVVPSSGTLLLVYRVRTGGGTTTVQRNTKTYEYVMWWWQWHRHNNNYRYDKVSFLVKNKKISHRRAQVNHIGRRSSNTPTAQVLPVSIG